MLFLKYISDVYSDHLKTYRKEFGGDELRIRRRLERERFILPDVEIKDPGGKTIDTFLAHFDSLYERRKARLFNTFTLCRGDECERK